MLRSPALLLAVLLIPLACANAPVPAGDYETTRIDEGVYQFRWESHNTFFVVTDDGVLAFDPISTEAAAVYASEIQRVAPGAPLRAVVYSHHHADHATGAPALMDAFGTDVPIIAHERAAARIEAEPSPELPAPDITFTDELTLDYGGRTIELHYLGRSHSDNLIVAYLPAERLAFAVDFVWHDRVGWRDLADYYFPDYFDAVRGLQALEYETIVFGHGPAGNRASVDRQLTYYQDLRAAVAGALERGLSEDEAAETVELPEYADWAGYADSFSLNVRGMYRVLAAREGT